MSSVRKSLVMLTKPVRRSIQLSIVKLPTLPLVAVRNDDTIGDGRLVPDPLDFGLAALLAQRQRIESARRGAGDVRAFVIELRTVARARKLVRVGVVVVAAAQMRTDRAEDDEAQRHDF